MGPVPGVRLGKAGLDDRLDAYLRGHDEGGLPRALEAAGNQQPRLDGRHLTGKLGGLPLPQPRKGNVGPALEPALFVVWGLPVTGEIDHWA